MTRGSRIWSSVCAASAIAASVVLGAIEYRGDIADVKLVAGCLFDAQDAWEAKFQEHLRLLDAKQGNPFDRYPELRRLSNEAAKLEKALENVTGRDRKARLTRWSIRSAIGGVAAIVVYFAGRRWRMTLSTSLVPKNRRKQCSREEYDGGGAAANRWGKRPWPKRGAQVFP